MNVVYVSKSYFADDKSRDTFTTGEFNWLSGHTPDSSRPLQVNSCTHTMQVQPHGQGYTGLFICDPWVVVRAPSKRGCASQCVIMVIITRWFSTQASAPNKSRGPFVLAHLWTSLCA